MSTLTEQLDELESRASAALAQAATRAETEAWYAEFLGRKGQMTALLRGFQVIEAPADRGLTLDELREQVRDAAGYTTGRQCTAATAKRPTQDRRGAEYDEDEEGQRVANSGAVRFAPT